MLRNTIALVIAGAIVGITATVSASVYSEDDYGEYFTDDLVIAPGDYYYYVDADETSIIDMFGGTVDELVPFAFSTANISGGLTKKLEALDDSTINISDGTVWDLSVYDRSVVNITGGTVEWLAVASGSEITITEGQFTYLSAQGSSVIDIAGYELSYNPDFNYDKVRGVWEGLLTGFWGESESAFGITTWDEATYDNLVLHDLGPRPSIPEPATLLLLGLGGLVFRRKA